MHSTQAGAKKNLHTAVVVLLGSVDAKVVQETIDSAYLWAVERIENLNTRFLLPNVDAQYICVSYLDRLRASGILIHSENQTDCQETRAVLSWAISALKRDDEDEYELHIFASRSIIRRTKVVFRLFFPQVAYCFHEVPDGSPVRLREELMECAGYVRHFFSSRLKLLR